MMGQNEPLSRTHWLLCGEWAGEGGGEELMLPAPGRGGRRGQKGGGGPFKSGFKGGTRAISPWLIECGDKEEKSEDTWISALDSGMGGGSSSDTANI